MWAVPYTQSTVIVDVIDARTNQLVWRGNDVDTLNMDHPEKTLSKAVDNVLDRFYKDNWRKLRTPFRQYAVLLAIAVVGIILAIWAGTVGMM